MGRRSKREGGKKITHTHTFHSGEPFPVLAACSISCRRPASIKQAQKSLLQLLSKSPCVLLPAATGGREAGRGGFFFFLPSFPGGSTFHSLHWWWKRACCCASRRRRRRKRRTRDLRSRDVWRKVRNPPAPCEEESDRLMFAAAAASS